MPGQCVEKSVCLLLFLGSISLQSIKGLCLDNTVCCNSGTILVARCSPVDLHQAGFGLQKFY